MRVDGITSYTSSGPTFMSASLRCFGLNLTVGSGGAAPVSLPLSPRCGYTHPGMQPMSVLHRHLCCKTFGQRAYLERPLAEGGLSRVLRILGFRRRLRSDVVPGLVRNLATLTLA